MLTKKHFEIIATALAKARPPEEPGSREILKAKDEQWANTITHVCDALAEINPRFDKDRFTDWINDQGRGRPGKG